MDSMERTDIIKNQEAPLYEQVAGQIASLVEKGTYRPGERVPSIRTLSRQMKVSVNTASIRILRLHHPAGGAGGTAIRKQGNPPD